MTLVRSALFNCFFFITTAMMTLVLGTYIRLVKPGCVLALAQLWARTMLWAARVICGIRLEVTGLEQLEGDEPRLIASLHQSTFDTIVWLTLLPRSCYVVKRELSRVPLFGALLKLAGMIVVDRSGGAAALRGLIRDAERAVRERRQIIIFPEGTRGEPDAILPLQPGIAAIAARTRLPVFPVVTDAGHIWGRRAFHKFSGTIHVRVLEPIAAGTERPALMRRLAEAFRTPVENPVG
ncbi:MAG TPA: lysophospholipid acyltransferase family protein [Acetobacteraceae bacterium]|jgi:1-acyl-sn-glycerol-3-phosphate acyltransferase|nr:lysophospholipid acyltransferase family protein [Acetobacteraceae bacterium]